MICSTPSLHNLVSPSGDPCAGCAIDSYEDAVATDLAARDMIRRMALDGTSEATVTDLMFLRIVTQLGSRIFYDTPAPGYSMQCSAMVDQRRLTFRVKGRPS